MNPDSNDFQGNIGNENYVPDDSVPLPAPDVTEDLSAEANNSSQEGKSHLYIGNKTKITMGYGMGKCSHSSTTGLHNMLKTGKMKVVAASIGKPIADSLDPTPLKAPVDVYKAPPVANSDKDNMDLPLEIRKITVESDYTSPMQVREQDDNIVIIGGGLDETVTVRTTDSATSARIMTWQDGILKESNTGTYTPPTDYPAYGKHLNLRVWQKYYYKVAVGSTQSLMVDAGTGSTHQTYFWRHGLYVGQVEPVDPATGEGDGLGGAWEDVDHWSPKMATDGSGEETTEVVNTIELSVCVSGSPVLKTFVMVDE